MTCNKVEFLEALDSSIFKAQNKMLNAPKATKRRGNFKLVKELGANVFALPGQWFVHWIIQDDGIVVIEAPLSSSYSKSTISYLREIYPKKPIKGVVIASDAYPHLAGVREYVANEIPIYVHKNNEELLNRIINALYISDPDSQSKLNKKPIYRFVDAKTSIESAIGPINIYPINGSAGSKMLMLEVETLKWLYAADLVQKLGDGRFFMPQYLTEIKVAIEVNNIKTRKVSAMHTLPVEWKEILDYLEAYSK